MIARRPALWTYGAHNPLLYLLGIYELFLHELVPLERFCLTLHFTYLSCGPFMRVWCLPVSPAVPCECLS